MNKVPAIDDQIKSIATGSAVDIHVKAGASAPDAREKGALKSVDWSKRTLVLHHQVYGDDRIIHFDKITFIGPQGAESLEDPLSAGLDIESLSRRL